MTKEQLKKEAEMYLTKLLKSLKIKKENLAENQPEFLIELSIKSYRDLLNERSLRFGIPIEVDRVPIEDIPKGTIYGTPFVITQGIDRVLIAKEVEEE